MKSITSLLNLEQLKELSTRSNFRYGQEMHKNGTIIVEKQNTFNIIAKVKSQHGEPRTVELHSTTKGLRWKCTCSSKKNYFCNHCVAVGLYLNDKLEEDNA